jgi:hypothetical protein
MSSLRNSYARITRGNVFEERIACLDDSGGARAAAWGPVWFTHYIQTLNDNGVNCVGKIFALNALTIWRSLNTAIYDDLTAVDALIAWQPTKVIIELGYNDLVSVEDGRTLVQVQGDVDDLLTRLAEELPNAQLIWAHQIGYDDVNFTPATLKNKGVPSGLMVRESSGEITEGLLHHGILETAVASATVDKFTDHEALCTYIDGKSELTATYRVPLWKLFRCGLTSSDNLHFSDDGMVCKSSLHIAGQLNPDVGEVLFMEKLADQSLGGALAGWVDFNAIFDAVLTSAGDGYTVTASVDPDIYLTALSALRDPLYLKNWFFPFKGELLFFPTEVDLDTTAASIFYWTAKDAHPNEPVLLSLGGAALAPQTRAADGSGVVTDDYGNVTDFASVGLIPGLIAGSYTLIFAIGDVAYPPIVLNVNTP